jgi:hypothetical protein
MSKNSTIGVITGQQRHQVKLGKKKSRDLTSAILQLELPSDIVVKENCKILSKLFIAVL